MKEIKEEKYLNFLYIPTKQNPADIASRGTSTSDLQKKRLWWNGPDDLLKPNNEWYFNKETEALRSETDSELTKSMVLYDAKLVAADGFTREFGEKSNLQVPYGIDIIKIFTIHHGNISV